MPTQRLEQRSRHTSIILSRIAPPPPAEAASLESGRILAAYALMPYRRIALAALAALLLLPLPVARAATSATLPEDLNRQNILRHVRDRDIRTVEGLVGSLPPLHKAHSVLVYKSQALGSEFVSRDHPRVISWGADSRFVLSWSTDPNSPLYQAVEFLEPVRDSWAAGIIDFSGTAPVIRYPAICSTCHGHLNKPLWGQTPDFPGTEGERGDVGGILGRTPITDEAALLLHHAADSANPRLAPLNLRDVIGDSVPTHTRTSLATSRDAPANVSARIEIPLVDDLGITLGWRHSQVLFHRAISEGRLEATHSTPCTSGDRFPRLERYMQDVSLAARGDTGALLEGIEGFEFLKYLNVGYHRIEDGFWFLVLHDLWQRSASVREALLPMVNTAIGPVRNPLDSYQLVGLFHEAFGARGRASIDARINTSSAIATIGAGWFFVPPFGNTVRHLQADPICDAVKQEGTAALGLVGPAGIGPLDVATLALLDSNGGTIAITEGVTLDLWGRSNDRFNVQAEVSPQNDAASVRVALMGTGAASGVRHQRLDSAAPFTLFDAGSEIKLAAGEYLVGAAAYPEADGGGVSGPTLTMAFNVPGELTDFKLIEAGGTGEIAIQDGARISQLALPQGALDIRATAVNPQRLGSVQLTLSGPNELSYTRAVNQAPYDWRGGGGFASLAPGLYTLTAVPYPSSNLSGTAGPEQTLSFEIAAIPLVEPLVTIAPGAPVTEGSSAQFTVRATPPPITPLTVSLEVAEAGQGDFVTSSDEVSTTLVVPHSGSKILAVDTQPDSDDEPDGAVTVTVVKGSGYRFSPSASASVAVSDDDATGVTLSASPGDIPENGGSKDLVVSLDRALVTGEVLDIRLSIGGTAERGSDYRLTCGSAAGVACANLHTENRRPRITFTGGTGAVRKVTVSLSAIDDENDEAAAETVTVSLGTLNSRSGTNLAGGASGSGSASFSITDDDDAHPVVEFAAATSTASEAVGTQSVALVLTPASTAPITLNYEVGGSAGEGVANDFTIVNSGAVSVASGATAATVPVAILDDSLDEPAETVVLTLIAGSGHTLGETKVHTLTLTDNDTPGVAVSTGTLELAEGGAAGSYTVELSSQPSESVMVTAASGDAGKVQVRGPGGADGASAVLTFTPTTWDQAQTVTVTPQRDADAADESVVVSHTVSNTGGYGGVTAPSVTVNLADSETPTLSVAIAPASASEGDSGNVYAAVTFTLAPSRSQTTTFNACLGSASTATHGATSDYQLVQASSDAPLGLTGGCHSYTIAATGTSGQVRLKVQGDSDVEPDETVVVALQDAPPGVVVSALAGSATFTILNDDVTPTACVSTQLQSAVEGYAQETQNGAEHVARWQRVLNTFAGNTAQGMTAAEARQMMARFWASRWGPVVTAIECLEGGGTDPEITVTGGAGIVEGGTAVFTVEASPAPAADLPVTLTVADDGSSDFLASGSEGTKTVTIRAGQSSATHTLSTVEDSDDEADGSVTATVENGNGYTVGNPPTGTVAVSDNDEPLSEVSITGSAAITEGSIATFNLSATPAPQSAITVSVNVVDSGDFASSGQTGSRQVSIGAGGTGTLNVSTSDDNTDEPDGTLTATVVSGQSYAPSSTNGLASIAVNDDDPAPAACVSTQLQSAVEGYARESQNGAAHVARWQRVLNTFAGNTAQGMTAAEARQMMARFWASRWGPVVTAIECLEGGGTDPEITVTGGAGIVEGGTAVFTVEASPAPAADLPVTLTIADDGSSDFLASGSEGDKTVTIPVGQSSATHTLSTVEDSDDEPDGSLVATVQDGSGYTVGNPSTGTVAVSDNDEPLPEVSITGSAAITEGGTATFNLSATPAPQNAITVSVNVVDSGEFANSGQTGSRQVTIGTGGTGALSVSTAADEQDEPDGSITATIQTGQAYTPHETDRSASIAVEDDDVPAVVPTIRISAGPAVDEGQTAQFTLHADPAPEVALTVHLDVTEGGLRDFVAARDEGRKTVTIAAEARSATYLVSTVEDDASEADGSVSVEVIADPAYRLAGNEYTDVRIRDDDSSLVLSVNDATVEEASGAFLEFTVKLSDESYEFVIVNYESRDVTATSGSDYGRLSGTLRFLPFEMEKRLKTQVFDDYRDEGDETMQVVLSDAYYARIGDGVGVGTIRDSDDGAEPAQVRVEPAALSLQEGGSPGSYLVSLSQEPLTDVSVIAAVAAPSVVRLSSAGEHPGSSAVLTFSPQDWWKAQAVNVVPQDDRDSADGNTKISFAVQGTGPYARLSAKEVSVAVADDDMSDPSTGFRLSVVPDRLREDAGVQTLEVSVVLNGEPLDLEAEQAWTTFGIYAVEGQGMAKPGMDYGPMPAATVVIPGGARSARTAVAIELIDNQVPDTDRPLVFEARPLDRAVDLGLSSAALTILDDDGGRPAEPTGLVAVPAGEGKVELSWQAPEQYGRQRVSGYRVEASNDGVNWYVLRVNTGSEKTFLTDTTMAVGQTRSYRVSAINRYGPGEPSVFTTGAATK